MGISYSVNFQNSKIRERWMKKKTQFGIHEISVHAINFNCLKHFGFPISKMKRFIKRQASAFAHHRTERVFRSRNRTMAPGMDLEHQLRTHLSDVEKMNAEERLIWASKTHPGHVAMSTSFGIHSAVLLHMATQVDPDLPVVWIDTGYLMPETVIFLHFDPSSCPDHTHKPL